MVETWVIGMLINLCGNMFINVGMNCVKYDHQQQHRLNRQNNSSSVNSNGSILSNGEQLDGVPNAPMPLGLQASWWSRCSGPLARCWFNFLRHGRWWYIGWCVFTMGNIANFISLSFTPQSLLAGLGSSQFLMNVICEWYFNSRHITARMVKATVLIIIGNTLIVAFASHESPKLTVEELFALLFETAFDIYVIILIVGLTFGHWFYQSTTTDLHEYDQARAAYLAAGGQLPVLAGMNGRQMNGNLLHGGRDSSSLNHPASGSLGSGSSSDHPHPPSMNGANSVNSGSGLVHPHIQHVHSLPHNPSVILPPLPRPIPEWRKSLYPFVYVTISAIIGTQSVLLAKATSDLIRTSIAGEQQFLTPFTYVILGSWLCTSVFWLYRMDVAVSKFHGPFIIPVLQVVWTLFSIIGGGIYFQEFSKMEPVAIALFILGVCIIISGVYLLAPQETPHRSGSALDEHLSQQDAMHLSDVELGHQVSPYELREHHLPAGSSGSSLSPISPPVVQIHGIFASSGQPAPGGDHDSDLSHSGGSGHSKDDIRSSPQDQAHTVVLTAPPPNKLIRVISTGRMRIEHDIDANRDVYLEPNRDDLLQSSPDFRPFQNSSSSNNLAVPSSSSSLTTSSSTARFQVTPLAETDGTLTDEEMGDQSTTTSGITPGLLLSATTASSSSTNLPTLASKHAAAYASSSSSMGVLSEAGLLGHSDLTTTTPPIRPIPSQVTWTPTRPITGGEFSSGSRPTSATSLAHHHSFELPSLHAQQSSVPPSPALSGYDSYGNHLGTTKRPRGMSFGFSMPMVDLNELEDDK